MLTDANKKSLILRAVEFVGATILLCLAFFLMATAINDQGDYEREFWAKKAAAATAKEPPHAD